MSIRGNIIKETTRLSYELIPRKKEIKAQHVVLEKLLQKAKKTAFGTHYDFGDIINSNDIMKSFSKRVPIFTYADFHKNWLYRSLEGERNVAWPGKIDFFALSSGTTVQSSKKIPVTDKMLRQFNRTSHEHLASLHHFDLDPKFYKSAVLTLGGSTQLESKSHYFQGDLTGILQKNKSLFFRPFTKPTSSIAKLTNWNEKMDKIIEKAPSWDIGAIAGVPTWVLMLLEGILKKYKVKSIHDIWPNFSLYLHGGIYLDGYREKIEQLCNKPIFFQNTFLASEGYFGYQKNIHEKGLNLLINHGIFYEFIEEKYFDLIKEQRDISKLPTLQLNEIEELKNYALVISTHAGLWRYLIGDVVNFTNKDDYRFNLVGRISQMLNCVGEHLSIENINEAVHQAAKNCEIEIEEFCVYPSKKNNRHLWYLGVSSITETRAIEVELNQQLCNVNDDYKTLRKYLLKSPKIIQLPKEKFYEYLASNNKLGGQHKFTRVMNKEQANAWEKFLTQVDVY
jgi:hypothetical protein